MAKRRVATNPRGKVEVEWAIVATSNWLDVDTPLGKGVWGIVIGSFEVVPLLSFRSHPWCTIMIVKEAGAGSLRKQEGAREMGTRLRLCLVPKRLISPRYRLRKFASHFFPLVVR